MSQDTVSAAAERIARALMGDARKVDCDIIESHIRELLVDQDGAAPTQEGDQRLIDLLTQAFGTRHQTIDDLAALILRANASRRDVARYRWIEKNAHFTGRYKDIGGFGVCVKLEILERDGIGAAIDAEMKRSGEAT